MTQMMPKLQGESVHPPALGDANPVRSVLGVLTLICLSLSLPVGLLLWVARRGCLRPIPSMLDPSPAGSAIQL